MTEDYGTFLDLGENLEDVPELVVLEGGEYEVRCTAAEIKQGTDKNGENYTMINLSMDVPAEPNSKGVYTALFLPKASDDAKKKNSTLRRIKATCTAFGVDQGANNQLNVSDFIGKTAWAILAVEESEDYGAQNRIRRFV